ncbi:histidine kinase dimerization/phospho-acceptor domain-containing protein [Paenibacillaceae bacterium WGS1546]|uniref:histidine kinase dimerization/phospho-acceptor domain-containing protein n=1 Tax=Cohnella sp. WGS1546 TaxID=3366810 RepID=UPI00372D5237
MKEAYRLQGRFAADASHELRTPLAILMTLTQLPKGSLQFILVQSTKLSHHRTSQNPQQRCCFSSAPLCR